MRLLINFMTHSEETTKLVSQRHTDMATLIRRKPGLLKEFKHHVQKRENSSADVEKTPITPRLKSITKYTAKY
jgi:hypothetical protein